MYRQMGDYIKEGKPISAHLYKLAYYCKHEIWEVMWSVRNFSQIARCIDNVVASCI